MSRTTLSHRIAHPWRIIDALRDRYGTPEHTERGMVSEYRARRDGRDGPRYHADYFVLVARRDLNAAIRNRPPAAQRRHRAAFHPSTRG